MADDSEDTNQAGQPTSSRPDEGFLHRWSQRKHQARTAAKQAPGESAPVKGPEEGNQPADTTVGKAELTDADMPPVETLGDQSDFSGFLSPGVSAELRRVALRKLFHLPKFNVCDGLDDYAEDYTTFEALGDVVTADMRYHMEREAEKLREQLLEEQIDEDGSAIADSEPAGSDDDSDASGEAQSSARSDSEAPTQSG